MNGHGNVSCNKETLDILDRVRSRHGNLTRAQVARIAISLIDKLDARFRYACDGPEQFSKVCECASVTLDQSPTGLVVK